MIPWIFLAVVGVTGVFLYTQSESGRVRQALERETERIDDHEVRLNDQKEDLITHEERLDVVEAGVATERATNVAQERDIAEAAVALEQLQEQLAEIENELSEQRTSLGELDALEAQAALLRRQQQELDARLREAIANNSADRKEVVELREELQKLREARAAENRRLQRIERILGIDPDLEP